MICEEKFNESSGRRIARRAGALDNLGKQKMPAGKILDTRAEELALVWGKGYNYPIFFHAVEGMVPPRLRRHFRLPRRIDFTAG